MSPSKDKAGEANEGELAQPQDPNQFLSNNSMDNLQQSAEATEIDCLELTLLLSSKLSYRFFQDQAEAQCYQEFTTNLSLDDFDKLMNSKVCSSAIASKLVLAKQTAPSLQVASRDQYLLSQPAEGLSVAFGVYRLKNQPKTLFVNFKQETGSKSKYLKLLKKLNEVFDLVRIKR